MNDDLISRLERKYRRYAVRNLMTFIICAMGVVYVLDALAQSFIPGGVSPYLFFSRDLILRGQLWRIVTFSVLPPGSNTLTVLFSLYLYWIIGSALNNHWGSFKFNLFYLCGITGSILSGLITGRTTNEYLNLSLFFAFAILFPDFQLLLFFILPVKMKYLALLNGLFFLVSFFQANLTGKVAMAAALVNLALFFWKDLLRLARRYRRKAQFRDAFRR